jgi:hypothetical protein
MANIVLKAFFKKYRDAIQNNQEYRNALNKEAVHYFEEEVENLKSQISLLDQKREKDFNNKYAQALATLKQSGMSNLTFTQISKTLRNKFLDHFTDLKEIGVDTGHVYSNLTIASKGKAQSELFEGTKLEIREYREIESLSAKDLKDIAKTIALISSYTSTLEQLDKIQNRKELVAFLKKSKTFREYARSTDLTTLANIKSAITGSFESKNSKGLAELGNQILKDSIGSIQVDTAINMARKITATESGVAVTFEIAAFNQFKGNIAQSVKTAFTGILDSMMQDPDGLPKVMDKALEKALLAEFTKEDLLKLFPNVSASKTIVEAYTDILSEILRTGKSKPYSSKAKTTDYVDSSKKIPLKMRGVKPKKIRVVEPAISLATSSVANLVSLQNLINQQLQDVVSANMGDGNSRSVLNYRTGRLASSAKVEYMSESRAGMITAFYSYMKNPYATFSDGGRQSSPKSRDPKLLISKSIREIAATQVGNRLRAVNI